MSDTVIKVENLSNQYRLGYVGTGSLVQTNCIGTLHFLVMVFKASFNQ